MIYSLDFVGKQTVTLICDSIGKHVKHVRNCSFHLQPYPGARIQDLTYFIDSGFVSLNYDVIIIHVGTNNVNFCQLADFEFYYNELVSVVKRYVKPCTKIILSAIIPRLIDNESTGNFVTVVNKALKSLCIRRNIDFVATYKPFLKFGRPVCELFSPICKLHPNYFGNLKLTNFYVQVISHC